MSVETIVRCASLVEEFPRMLARDWLEKAHVLDTSFHREVFAKFAAKFNIT